jgi:hypothetical protein
MTIPSVFKRLLLVSLLAALAGCGKGSEQGPTPASTADGLKELVGMYEYLAYQKKGPPKKVADLDEFIDTLPNALPRVQSGEYVVIWGVGLAKTGSGARAILAYEKKAPVEGGAVLLRSGEVKQMTAAEFQAAPKAK